MGNSKQPLKMRVWKRVSKFLRRFVTVFEVIWSFASTMTSLIAGPVRKRDQDQVEETIPTRFIPDQRLQIEDRMFVIVPRSTGKTNTYFFIRLQV